MKKLIALTFALFTFFGTSFADQVKKVACVGDSITYGFGIKGRETLNYPYVLQTMLGDKYKVENFGVRGRSIGKKTKLCYTKEKAYRASLEFKPDIVVIMLGTNDAAPQNMAFLAELERDFSSLVESYIKLPERPAVYICTVPPSFPSKHAIQEVNLARVRAVVNDVAKKKKLPVIDVYSILKEDEIEFFQKDKIHPSAEGAREIAEIVFDAITKKETSSKK